MYEAHQSPMSSIKISLRPGHSKEKAERIHTSGSEQSDISCLAQCMMGKWGKSLLAGSVLELKGK